MNMMLQINKEQDKYENVENKNGEENVKDKELQMEKE